MRVLRKRVLYRLSRVHGCKLNLNMKSFILKLCSHVTSAFSSNFKKGSMATNDGVHT